MLKALSAFVLAAGVATLPAFGQADCPSPDSIDRYASTARDALSALDGLVPESQQQTLEDQYAAMSVLRWEWQGKEAIASDASAVGQIADCLASDRCVGPDDVTASATADTLAPSPSDELVAWARVELSCDPPPEESDTATEEDSESEASDDLLVAPDPDPTPQATVETSVVELSAATEQQPAISLETDDDILAEIAPLPLEPIERASLRVEAEPESAQLGFQTALVQLVHGNLSKAVDTLQASCFQMAIESDPTDACEVLFDSYDQLAVRANPAKFLAFTDRLCALDYERGCTSLTRYFGAETLADAHQAALDHYEKTCDRGHAGACASASEYLFTGRAAVPDFERARERLERSCDLGQLASCQRLADFYLRGVGGETSVEQALALNAASCPAAQSSDPEVCVSAADFVLINLEPGEDRAALVRAFTKRACDVGHDVGCAWYSENLEFGIGGEIDLAGAKQARLTACDFGHKKSCRVRS